jgi:hypothetical protein
MSDPSIYRPYSRLVRVRVRGRWFDVPENNILLRCFQYIAPGVPYGPFCWNGDCENDKLRCKEAGAGASKNALACQTLVKDGMEIDEISPELARVLAPALEAKAAAPEVARSEEELAAPAVNNGSTPRRS